MQTNGCCDGLLSKALLLGILETAEKWQCPKCGALWICRTNKEGWSHWIKTDAVGLR